ncbi:hypothetical protein, partial [Burkholderia cenocepacia]|uniref:hypothetical protein n=1 Tax=Burkholderia cenocepacia TaxID=95486 RepID=UPI0038CC1C50
GWPRSVPQLGPPQGALPRGRRRRERRVVVPARGGLATTAAVGGAQGTDAAWTTGDHATTTASAAALPPVTMTSCTRGANNVATFRFANGSGSLAPTGYGVVVTNSATGAVVGTGTLASNATGFTIDVGALALLQRYTVTVRATNAGWSSTTPAQGHVDILLGLALWSCGTGP